MSLTPTGRPARIHLQPANSMRRAYCGVTHSKAAQYTSRERDATCPHCLRIYDVDNVKSSTNNRRDLLGSHRACMKK